VFVSSQVTSIALDDTAVAAGDSGVKRAQPLPARTALGSAPQRGSPSRRHSPTMRRLQRRLPSPHSTQAWISSVHAIRHSLRCEIACDWSAYSVVRVIATATRIRMVRGIDTVLPRNGDAHCMCALGARGSWGRAVSNAYATALGFPNVPPPCRR
jgi:hypothetical protein